MATVAWGLTKNARIWVRSASPSIVTDIDVLALGASSMTRIQLSSVLAAEIRVDVAIMPVWPCCPLGATVLISVAAARLREAAGRTPRGIGALAATTLARSTAGGEGGGA